MSENQNPITESSGIVGVVNCRLPQPYWCDGDCVLYNGRAEEVLPCMESESIDLTVTSPPYDNLRTYNGYTWDFEAIAKELYRVTKPGGVCVWVVGDQTIDGSETLTSAKQKIFFREGCGWNIHDTMIMRCTKPPLTHNRYEQEFEYMVVLSKGKPTTFNPIKQRSKKAGLRLNRAWGDSNTESGDAVRVRAELTKVADQRIIGNVWEYAIGMNGSTKDDEAYEHPAIFPEQLAIDHIRTWSNAGDTVLDCFMGSGTTAKAAKLLKRKSIGIEISDKYCDLIVRRLNPPMPLFDTVGAANGS